MVAALSETPPIFIGGKILINVAIDGPAGAGKSTIAKAVAKKLGYCYIDTGALYRAIAYYIIKHEIDYDSGANFLRDINIEVKFIDDSQHIFLNSVDVTDELRTEEISMLTSKISSKKYIRDFLLDLQRTIASKNKVIMDGRDIGSVVLPNAHVKIFLTAAPEKRAERRFIELSEKNISCSYDEILRAIVERDNNDINREIAPLKKVDNAILIDTSNLSLDESVQAVYDVIIKAINIQN